MSQCIYTSGRYAEKNPGWHAEDSAWKADQVIKILRANHISPTSVCEIGCGAGEVLRQLHARMAEHTKFVGYEISPQAYELCQARVADRLEFRLGNPFDEAIRFDVILAIDVIEHVEDCFGFLRALKGKAEHKILHIPLDLSVQTVLRSAPLLRVHSQCGHIHFFTKELALAALEDAGYEVRDYFYTAGAVELPGKSLNTKMLNLPRKALFAISRDFAVRVLGGYSLMALAR